MLGRLMLMLQATGLDCQSLDLFSPFDDGRIAWTSPIYVFN
jgi:hypothetical protein